MSWGDMSEDDGRAAPLFAAFGIKKNRKKKYFIEHALSTEPRLLLDQSSKIGSVDSDSHVSHYVQTRTALSTSSTCDGGHLL